MTDTSISLLESLASADHASWDRLVEVYAPLLRRWLSGRAPDQDLDDLIQDVLLVVVRRLPEFRRNPRAGAFRCWLRTIAVNCLRDHYRSQHKRPRATGDSNFLEMLNQLADDTSGLSQLWEQEHDRYVAEHLLKEIEPQFEPTTWRAFCRVAREGVPAPEVARELGITENAVYIAKSRVLSRLRQVANGILG
jgi:RNA polymerase sigma-70 factor (ECF subfamily)